MTKCKNSLIKTGRSKMQSYRQAIRKKINKQRERFLQTDKDIYTWEVRDKQTNKHRDSKQKTLTDIDRKRGTCR